MDWFEWKFCKVYYIIRFIILKIVIDKLFTAVNTITERRLVDGIFNIGEGIDLNKCK